MLIATATLIALTLLQSPEQTVRRWIPHTGAWIACAMLTLRGVTGLVVDGASDPIWWPAFLVGGILFRAVAWLACLPKAAP